MELFFDVYSIRSGELWESKIIEQLNQSDVLFLCWSNNAKNSVWVEKEWKYFIENHGVDNIEPIPLEPIDNCEPPQELSGKNFNDILTYLH